MNKSQHFETNRLRIEPLCPEDHAFILELVNSDGWLKNIGDRHVHQPDDAILYIQNILLNPDICYWVVKLKKEMTALGILSFIQRTHLPFPDLGFAFLPRYAGQGFALEAATQVLSSLFNTGLYDHILATTLPDNDRSIRLLKNLGFELDSTLAITTENTQIFSKSIPGKRIKPATYSPESS